jgi:hypothetical protein
MGTRGADTRVGESGFREHPLIRKAIAFWPVILALSPFTAPFSICDPTILLTGRAPASVQGRRVLRAASFDDPSLAQAAHHRYDICTGRRDVS